MVHFLSKFKLIMVLGFTILMTSSKIMLSDDFKKNNIEINDPYITNPFVGAKSAAGYLIIKNHGNKELNLLSVSTSLGKAMLHKTTLADDNIVKMEHLMRINISAGDELVMQPGNFHIMITGISQPLILGEKIPATLKFSGKVELDIEFTVQELK